MQKSREWLAQIGAVALAGIAVLGWVREPEKPYLPQAVQRAIYQQPDAGGPPVVRELPADAEFDESSVEGRVPPRVDADVVRRRSASSAPVAADQRGTAAPVPEQPVAIVPSTPPASGPPPAKPTDGPAEPELRARPAESNPQVVPRPDRQTQPIVTENKDRSTKERALIIGGAAAAGAAIGAMAGGGKGAAIGAITGGAGGYVYDRMTRRNDPRRNTTYGPAPGDSTDVDYPDKDPAVKPAPLASRFGTPRFQ
jgi:hypothetical protein